MATFRVGVGSFNIKDGAVGFGTDTDGLGNLRVKGVTKTTDIKVSGASTLARYSGFAADNIDVIDNLTITTDSSTIGDIVVGVGTSVIISSGSSVTSGTVESVSIGTHFSPPVGNFENRNEDPVEGMMRFNIDLNTMEFYNGDEWRQFNYQINSESGTRGRGIFVGGYTGPAATVTKQIDFFNIGTGGRSEFFGELVAGQSNMATCSSSVRGFTASQYQGPAGTYTDEIDYITIASEGNAIDFGDRTISTYGGQGVSSSTRGVFIGGHMSSSPNRSNTIDYIEMHTTGNALDFGDMGAQSAYRGAAQSPIRGFVFGGYGPSPAPTKGSTEIDRINIASKGNGVTIGTLNSSHTDNVNACSNSTRAMISLGSDGISGDDLPIEGLQIFELSSEGKTSEFGDLMQARCRCASLASNTRAIFGGGSMFAPSATYFLDYECVFFATKGSAIDFGTLNRTDNEHRAIGGISDCHGGLGGF